MDAILQTVGLAKQFRGFWAVDGVNLEVQRGHIHALIGPNGAGKTTVFNLLTRFLSPTAGKIIFNGTDITNLPPAHVARNGIVRSFQISSVFPGMTVLENVRVALQRKLNSSFQFWKSKRSLGLLDERARELLAQVGLVAAEQRLAGELVYSHRRALELATTLATEPELLLLDEPTQGMGQEDVPTITALIKAAAVGRTTIMVEHNMSVVAGICDQITVLKQGTVLAQGSYDEVSSDPAVMEAYLGPAGSEEDEGRRA